MRVSCLVTERTRTPKVFNNVLHKVVETVDVRFDETNGSQREHLPSVIDEPAPEDSIKFKATKDVIPTKESAEEFIPEHDEHQAGAPEENGAEENAPEENADQIPRRQPAHPRIANEVQIEKIIMTLKHQVLSHAQKLHICLTFVGTLLLSLSQSPLR